MESTQGTEAQKKPAEITIIEKRCKRCEICVVYCQEKVLGQDRFKAIVLHPEKCTRCMRCEILCPDFAIYVK
jgi:2-oxoglutarate ferredoxin oxidoreductase subunit delta